MKKNFLILNIILLLLLIITSGCGIFWVDGGVSFTSMSQYNNIIELYGNGIYKNDAAFLAPIFRGTDLVMLFMTTPLFIYFLYSNQKQQSFKSLLRLMSLLFVIFYYAIHMAFGVIFNYLHLVYTALLSVSFFTLVVGTKLLNAYHLSSFRSTFRTTLGLKMFICISGIALFGAWLPDIIQAHLSNKPPTYLENYTTSITYILDMGFISPLLFISLYLLDKHPFHGVCLLSMLLYLSILIGIILPTQTWLQIQSGITIPIPALLTKVLIFILLSTFAFYFNQKLYKTIQ